MSPNVSGLGDVRDFVIRPPAVGYNDTNLKLERQGRDPVAD